VDAHRWRQCDCHEPIIVAFPLYYYPMLYHTPRHENVRLYDDRFQTRIHYFGAAILVEDELMDDRALRELDAQRVWLVNGQGGGWGFHAVPAPPGWRRVSVARFQEAFSMQGDIVVAEFVLPRR
jgi:catechol 2,3-dioxygenase-like lactoylglutathione lyase family enzyme